MTAGEVVGGAFLSAFLQVLFDRLASQDFLNLFKGRKLIEELVQRFRTKFQSANVLLKDAEEKQLTDEGVRNWLHNMKEVIFRADELTDNIDYEALRRKLEGPSMRSTFFAMFYKYVEEGMGRILADLEHLLNQNAVLGMNALSLRSHATPFVRESEVYGRKDDKEAIMKLMLPDEDCGDKIPVLIPIVGRDGIGKTTLAQLVYNDKRVTDHFKITVWVKVSTESDALNITKKIFKGVTTRDSSNEELSLLLGELEEALKTKKFLLVLDDVWNEDLLFWDQLRPLFTFGASGSKIIITSSSRTVAERAVNNNGEEIYHLRVLKDSICWEFFFRHAFENEDLNDHPDLRKIGEEIVRKCEGLPVAVKSVAALLGSISSPQEWRKMLENKIWDLKLQETTSKNILPALWLSYSYLSPQLKRCFAYCSIFPKDHEFLKREVILLWMAEGLLQSREGATMEDVGDDYFKTLTSRSFFQPVKSKSSFTMHGCMHDLATFVLGNFGFRLEENNLHCLALTVRHLSFMKEKVGDMRYFQFISKARHLRTFLPLESNQPFRDVVPLEKLLTEARCLRVLSLSQYPCFAELPNSILESKSLRYLDLSSTSIKDIPDKICTLYNLETLLLSNCKNLTRLPSEIRCLIKLRHLDFAGSPIEELPPRICELKDLQTLTRFIVCKEHSRIEELGDLQQLHGEFEICGLENMVDVKKVSVANLRDKKFLTSLGLYWDGESCYGTSEAIEILEELQPHQNLKALRIYGFAGERFADWIGHQSFGNIVEVQLSECKNCKSLPPLGQLPSLKNLQISGFKSVVTIGEEFYSDSSSTTEPFKFLEVLRFEDMAKWEEWLFTKDRVFPSLKELVFYECPELDVWLPDCFPSLTKLLVSHCRELMPLLNPTSHQRNKFSSLEELEIFACPEQVIFLQGGLPSSLKKIRISRCRRLEHLHDKNFQHLTSLKSLEIIECKELHRLPEELPTHPFELSIVECPFLESGGCLLI